MMRSRSRDIPTSCYPLHEKEGRRRRSFLIITRGKRGESGDGMEEGGVRVWPLVWNGTVLYTVGGVVLTCTCNVLPPLP